MDGEEEYICSATLTVLGDELIPQRVTELLGLEPSRSWSKGERKSFVRRDGAPHYFNAVHEWGGWKRLVPDEMRDAGLAEQLAWWCDELEGRGPALRELEAQGFFLRVDCFVEARESASLELSADLQARLSRLRLNLTVCFSSEHTGPADEPDEPAQPGAAFRPET